MFIAERQAPEPSENGSKSFESAPEPRRHISQNF